MKEDEAVALKPPERIRVRVGTKGGVLGFALPDLDLIKKCPDMNLEYAYSPQAAGGTAAPAPTASEKCHEIYVEHLKTCKDCMHKATVDSLCSVGRALYREAYPAPTADKEPTPLPDLKRDLQGVKDAFDEDRQWWEKVAERAAKNIYKWARDLFAPHIDESPAVKYMAGFIAAEIEGQAPPAATPLPETLSEAWQTYFERLGIAATVDVVNATANLVIAEREIYAAAAKRDTWEQAARIVDAKLDHESQQETYADGFDMPDSARWHQGRREILEVVAAALRSQAASAFTSPPTAQ